MCAYQRSSDDLSQDARVMWGADFGLDHHLLAFRMKPKLRRTLAQSVNQRKVCTTSLLKDKTKQTKAAEAAAEADIDDSTKRRRIRVLLKT